MGMFTDPGALLCRWKLRWAGIIQKQERTDRRSQFRVRKKCPHGKSIANPVATGTAQDAL
jgi:hypothetical protein